LWKNKKEKIKREVLYLPLSKGGLKFPCFGTMVKALPLGWISRFLLGSDESWKAIPNSYFNKLGGLPFILKYNYNAKKLSEKLPIVYRDLLDYFADLRYNFEDMHQKTFILWNNKDITIRTNFWRCQQIISAIPVCLRNEASQSLITRRLSEQDDNLFQLSKDKVLHRILITNKERKKARNSFFGLGVYLLKSNFRTEDNKLRFP